MHHSATNTNSMKDEKATKKGFMALKKITYCISYSSSEERRTYLQACFGLLYIWKFMVRFIVSTDSYSPKACMHGSSILCRSFFLYFTFFAHFQKEFVSNFLKFLEASWKKLVNELNFKTKSFNFYTEEAFKDLVFFKGRILRQQKFTSPFFAKRT